MILRPCCYDNPYREPYDREDRQHTNSNQDIRVVTNVPYSLLLVCGVPLDDNDLCDFGLGELLWLGGRHVVGTGLSRDGTNSFYDLKVIVFE